MNTIALLSGWSHQRNHSPTPSSSSSRRASLSRHNDGVGGDGQQGNGNGALSAQQEFDNDKQVLDSLIDGQNDEESSSRIPGSSRSTASSLLPPAFKEDLTHIVKSPEAAAYEDLEEAAARISHSTNAASLDPASVYPTPPPSRLPTPTEEAIDEASGSAIDGTSSIDTRNGTASDLYASTTPSHTVPASRFQGKLFRRHVPPPQSHDEVRTPQHQRRLSDRHTRALARSFPVRCIARIYMLLRKFFALFGIRLQPVPALTNSPEAAPGLTAPVLAVQPSTPVDDAPPSYQDATQVKLPTNDSVPASSSKGQRWKIGSLLSRSKVVGDSTTDKDTASNTAEGYASTSSDEWTPSEEKKLLRKSELDSGRIPSSISDPTTRGHHHAKTASTSSATAAKASVAQLALSKPKLLVLDLDETLIHSTSRMSYGSSAVTSSVDGRSGWSAANTSGLKVRVVEVVLDGRSVIYHVYKRPWVDFFLRKVSSWYTVVIFTASLQEYADPVIDWLDQGTGMLSTRLFRESCTFVNGSYVKDLSIVDKDLARVCLVDNSPISYAINPGEREVLS